MNFFTNADADYETSKVTSSIVNCTLPKVSGQILKDYLSRVY